MKELDAFICGPALHISINNIPEFKELLEQAEKEATALQKTIQQLRSFDLKVSFETVSATSQAE